MHIPRLRHMDTHRIDTNAKTFCTANFTGLGVASLKIHKYSTSQSHAVQGLISKTLLRRAARWMLFCNAWQITVAIDMFSWRSRRVFRFTSLQTNPWIKKLLRCFNAQALRRQGYSTWYPRHPLTSSLLFLRSYKIVLFLSVALRMKSRIMWGGTPQNWVTATTKLDCSPLGLFVTFRAGLCGCSLSSAVQVLKDAPTGKPW